MRIIIEPTPAEVAQRAARTVADLVRRTPRCVLAVPTGQTPLATYEELARMHREQDLDFAGVQGFLVDEYVGLAPGDPRSFRASLQEHFLGRVNIPPGNARAPDTGAADLGAACARYEAEIAEAGGIDLVLLGIGHDGHIGFNEPGSSLGSRTRPKTLTEETARANAARFGDPSQVPRLVLTMGVGTILAARRCVLLATGADKAQAIHAAVEGPITAQVTASALQLHPAASVIVDEAAAGRLNRAAYYREVERLQTALERRGR